MEAAWALTVTNPTKTPTISTTINAKQTFFITETSAFF
jgi:hypothetical protein